MEVVNEHSVRVCDPRVQEAGWSYGGRRLRDSTCLSSALSLPVMYGDRVTSLNHNSTAAAAAAAAAGIEQLYGPTYCQWQPCCRPTVKNFVQEFVLLMCVLSVFSSNQRIPVVLLSFF